MNPIEPTLWQPLAQMIVLAGVGLVCRMLGVLSDAGVRPLTGLVMNVMLPVMLLLAGLQTDLTVLLRQGPLVALAGLAFPAVGYLVGIAVARLLRLPRAQASVVRVTAALCNTAFVGIPVCSTLWGSDGALLAAIYDQALNVPLLILGPLEYGQAGQRPAWRSLLQAPMLWGMALGIGGRVVGLSLPAWLAAPLGMLGNATLPLSLVLVGALALPGQVSRDMGLPLVAGAASRLVLVPLLALAALSLLGVRGMGMGVIVLQTAMPASVLATIMAREYGGDAQLAAAAALLTIVLSVLTIPALASVLAGI